MVIYTANTLVTRCEDGTLEKRFFMTQDEFRKLFTSSGRDNRARIRSASGHNVTCTMKVKGELVQLTWKKKNFPERLRDALIHKGSAPISKNSCANQFFKQLPKISSPRSRSRSPPPSPSRSTKLEKTVDPIPITTHYQPILASCQIVL